jgi:hypothetical protein
MTHEILQDILYSIKHNTVKYTEFSEVHFMYELFGEKNKLLMSADVFNTEIPRATIKINNKHFAHINHFAQTEEQFMNNYYVWDIISHFAEKNAMQYGVLESHMTKKEIAISKFLRENSIRKY